MWNLPKSCWFWLFRKCFLTIPFHISTLQHRDPNWAQKSKVVQILAMLSSSFRVECEVGVLVPCITLVPRVDIVIPQNTGVTAPSSSSALLMINIHCLILFLLDNDNFLFQELLHQWNSLCQWVFLPWCQTLDRDQVMKNPSLLCQLLPPATTQMTQLLDQSLLTTWVLPLHHQVPTTLSFKYLI